MTATTTPGIAYLSRNVADLIPAPRRIPLAYHMNVIIADCWVRGEWVGHTDARQRWFAAQMGAARSTVANQETELVALGMIESSASPSGGRRLTVRPNVWAAVASPDWSPPGASLLFREKLEALMSAAGAIADGGPYPFLEGDMGMLESSLRELRDCLRAEGGVS